MGSSTPYVSSQDKKMLSAYATVSAAYARSINKNSTEWSGKDLRGFIDFLWKTKAHRVNATVTLWKCTCDVHDATHVEKNKEKKKKRVA